MHAHLYESGPMQLAPVDPSFDLNMHGSYERCIEPDVPAVIEPVKTINVTPKRIVRAVTGATELRLLSETADGIYQRFLIEKAFISPYSAQRQPLLTGMKRRGTDDFLPMQESEAHRSFDALVR